ncbi:prepilin-type N-terminal cleavage/methylation domain-containing protein [Pleurocapsales cyanobacterium LEGE 10410]|nr:prepilin-type N-terminal cleavage/methylation domain-containing protein [Pleurocapsales cyanobacterium LEGE 10410]
MNNVFTAKLLQNLSNKKSGKGFTLIELLVVVIIIGVLAAVALPNLLGQVAKGRQSEARNNLGAVNRSQQAHRLEEGLFGTVGAPSTAAATAGVTQLPIRITGDNYVYTDQLDPTATFAAVDASAVTAFQNDILDYTGAVGQTATGVVEVLICENDEVAGTGGTAAVDATEDTTTAGDIACGTNSTAL